MAYIRIVISPFMDSDLLENYSSMPSWKVVWFTLSCKGYELETLALFPIDLLIIIEAFK